VIPINVYKSNTIALTWVRAGQQMRMPAHEQLTQWPFSWWVSTRARCTTATMALSQSPLQDATTFTSAPERVADRYVRLLLVKIGVEKNVKFLLSCCKVACL